MRLVKTLVLIQPTEPCLECGEAVHPIAGRCKHCRADLTALRRAAQRAALAAERRAQAEPLTAVPAAAPSPLRRRAEGPHPAPGLAEHEPTLRVARQNRRFGRSSRAWLGALAILLLSIASGIMAHRVYARVRGASAPPLGGSVAASQAATTSAAADDPMRPGPDAPGAADPTDPYAAPDPDPDPDPAPTPSPPFGFDLFSLLDPDGRGGAGRGLGLGAPGARRPRGAPRDAATAEQFVTALGAELCERVMACGLGQAMPPAMCDLMMGQLLTPDLVDPGQCQFDPTAAKQCLAAVGGMRCDAGDDPAQLLALLDGVGGCTSAIRCD
jgi:hypothetical protein